MNLFILLQAASPVIEMADQAAQTAPEETYLSLVLKGDGYFYLYFFYRYSPFML